MLQLLVELKEVFNNITMHASTGEINIQTHSVSTIDDISILVMKYAHMKQVVSIHHVIPVQLIHELEEQIHLFLGFLDVTMRNSSTINESYTFPQPIVTADRFLHEIFYHPEVLSMEPLLNDISIKFLRAFDVSLTEILTDDETYILPALARNPSVLTALMNNLVLSNVKSDQNSLIGSVLSVSAVGKLARYLSYDRLFHVLNNTDILDIVTTLSSPEHIQEQCEWIHAGMEHIATSPLESGIVISNLLIVLSSHADTSTYFLAVPACMDILIRYGEDQHALHILTLIKVQYVVVIFILLLYSHIFDAVYDFRIQG